MESLSTENGVSQSIGGEQLQLKLNEWNGGRSDKINRNHIRKSMRLEKVEGGKKLEVYDTEAWVSVHVLEVNTITSQFTCDLELELLYIDKELVQYYDEIGYDEPVALSEAKRKKYGLEMNQPRVMLENCDNPQQTYYNLEVNFATGEVFIQYNWVAIFHEVLELWRFPFDRQVLRVYIKISDINPISPKEWSADNREKPFLIEESLVDFAYAGYEGMVFKLPENSSIRSCKGVWRETEDPSYEVTCQITVEVQRLGLYYIFNFVFITFLVVGINFSVIGSSIENQERLGISVGLVLTLVTFKFVMLQSIPVVSYITLLDKYNLFAFVMMCIGVLEHTIVSERAVAYFQFTEDEANSLDIGLQLALSGFWVLVHIVLSILFATGYFYTPWYKVYVQNDEGIVAMVEQRNRFMRTSRKRKDIKPYLWKETKRLLV